MLAKGGTSTPDGDVFKFLTIATDLGGASTSVDIIRKLARAFRSELNKHDELQAIAKNVWDWFTNWEVLGVKYQKPDQQAELDVEIVVEEFVGAVACFLDDTQHHIDGVLFLVDEADWPDVNAGLGQYLKFITERLGRVGCHRVIFGLAGLPALLNKLRESHESSPRLFRIMLLEPLEVDERKRVIEIGLSEANDKNQTKTSISDDAMEFVADLSEGYPHFVQQFAYSAFDVDDDGLISVLDVSEGAFGENGALSQLGDKFFSQMYHARISSEDYRRVPDAMAEHGDEWCARKTIIAESGVSESNVNNAIKSLKDKDIIIVDDARRGYYKLPTRSFATWINATMSAKAKGDAERAF